MERYKKADVVVTQHPALVTYLRQIGHIDESSKVIAHATPANISGRIVCGVLPHTLSCLTKLYIEVPLDIPIELRGTKLTLDQVRRFIGPIQAYLNRAL